MSTAPEVRTPVVVVQEHRGLAASNLPLRPGMSLEEQAGPANAGLQWTAGGTALAITLFGSSSDPVVPISWSATEDGLELHVGRRHNASLVSADLAARTTVIQRPAHLDPGTPTTIRIDGRSYDLPAVHPHT